MFSRGLSKWKHGYTPLVITCLRSVGVNQAYYPTMYPIAPVSGFAFTSCLFPCANVSPPKKIAARAQKSLAARGNGGRTFPGGKGFGPITGSASYLVGIGHTDPVLESSTYLVGCHGL